MNLPIYHDLTKRCSVGSFSHNGLVKGIGKRGNGGMGEGKIKDISWNAATTAFRQNRDWDQLKR